MEAHVHRSIGIAAAAIVAVGASAYPKGSAYTLGHLQGSAYTLGHRQGSAYTLGHAQGKDAARKETRVTTTAKGTFDVKLAPQASGDREMDEAIGRMTIDKRFHGDLDGTSKGQMLAVRTAVDGSAGYVAMEKVTGTLHGRTGTFVLQHSGTMTRGAQALTLTVVPDSGTGELTGLAGRMGIRIDGGAHYYELEYTTARQKD